MLTDTPQIEQSPAPNRVGDEVLAATLQAQYANLNVEQLVLLDKTHIPKDPKQLEADMAYVRQELADSIDESTIQAFLQHNQESQTIEDPPDLDFPIQLISEEQFNEFFETTGEAGWDSFFEAYPGSPGIIRASRAGISPNGEQALIYLEDRAAQDSAQGLYIYLEKSGPDWRVERALVAWVS